MKYHTLSFRL